VVRISSPHFLFPQILLRASIVVDVLYVSLICRIFAGLLMGLAFADALRVFVHIEKIKGTVVELPRLLSFAAQAMDAVVFIQRY
jgi:hypothetical protein